jgi:hypothetical protein
MTLWKCRLTVVNSQRTSGLFAASSGWKRTLSAAHVEWLELAVHRDVCQFETDQLPVESLRRLSRRWPTLTFLLDYENELNRIKGLAKAKAGEVEHCEIGY